jgi:predicted kinase
MSEYMEKHTVSRLVGAPPGYVGYEEGGQLTEAVRRRPYAVILLDEIEKAHSDVFNVLLQLMDDGRLTDGQGRTVDFTNTVVIMTSNLGAGGGEQQVMAALHAHFKPEFLNRIDEIVLFHRLTEEHIAQIVDIQVEQLAARLRDRGLELTLTDAAREHIATVGYDPDFGARPLKRVLQREVADPIALELLKGAYTEGDTIVVDAAPDGHLVFEAAATAEVVGCAGTLSGMTAPSSSPAPTLVVVSGPAGSGKTTLAHRLGRELACPVVSRDELREGMARTLGEFAPEAGDELARRTLAAFFDVLRLLLERGVTVIAEAAFQDHVWTPNLTPLTEIARVRVVQCHAPPAVATRRVAEHASARRVHADAALLAALERDGSYFTDFRRVAIDAPTITVDTTDGYTPPLGQIAGFVSG